MEQPVICPGVFRLGKDSLLLHLKAFSIITLMYLIVNTSKLHIQLEI